MPGPSPTVCALRSLLSERFPERSRRAGGAVPVSVPALDGVLGGGLPAGRLTELVSAVPSGGGQTVVARLLAATQAARQRVALVDGADAFAPETLAPGALRHLVWVRCAGPSQAFAAADILVRDGNYAAVVVDLRGCAERELRRTPSSTWHRLQRAAEASAVAVLVQTAFPLVPAVPWRLVLNAPLSLAESAGERQALSARLEVLTERCHALAAEELAG